MPEISTVAQNADESETKDSSSLEGEKAASKTDNEAATDTEETVTEPGGISFDLFAGDNVFSYGMVEWATMETTSNGSFTG